MVDGDQPHVNGLLPQHRADLHRSGLSDDQIARCKFYSITNRLGAERALQTTRLPDGIWPALGIPYRGPGGYKNGYVRLKPDKPRLDEHGKPVKYESPRDVPNRAYFPPETLPALSDPSAPLLLTEGEKKAAAADQEGFPCIGLVGVWGWQKSAPSPPTARRRPSVS
jgi:hypothetical protein